EAALKADARARARVSMFRATGPELSSLYDGVLREPVPAHLREFVLSYGKERAALESLKPAASSFGRASQPSRRPRLRGGLRDRLIPQSAGWQLAAALAAALIVGGGAGFLLGGDGSGPNLAALRPGQVLKSGVLHQVLETLPSNEERAAGPTPQATPPPAV